MNPVKQVSERTVPLSMHTSRVLDREEVEEAYGKCIFAGATAFSASSVALACHGIMTGSMTALSFGAAPFALLAAGAVVIRSEPGSAFMLAGIALAATACNVVGLAAIGAAGGSIALTSIACLSIAAVPLTYLAIHSDYPLALHANGWL